jgi:hypothetical protein
MGVEVEGTVGSQPYWAALRDRRAETLRLHAALGVEEIEHGLYSTYVNYRCRCWKCTTANWVVCTLRNDRKKGLW